MIPRHRTARRTPGFTLIELMAVISIVALVAGAGVVLLGQLADMRGRAERSATATRQAAWAIDQIAIALNNAYRPGEDDRILFEGIDDAIDNRSADEFRLLATGVIPVRDGQKESDVREVAYSLRVVDGQPLAVLVRRLDPTRNLDPGGDGGGVVEPIAEQVVSFDMLYYDGLTWSSRWPVEFERYPRVVRIELVVAEVDERGLPKRGDRAVVRLRRLVPIAPLPDEPSTGDGSAAAVSNIGGAA
ncbi:MAG: type II secretion system protein GspJ [Planctomycetota bacterium]